jgi:cholesterol oxidase
MSNISRRDFFRTGGATLGVLGSSVKSWAQRSDFVDALIIGSGFGGAIAAYRLAQAGIRSVVLERGLRWPIREDGDTFATFKSAGLEDGRGSWLSDFATGIDNPPVPIDRFTGVLELIEADGMTVRTGAGVGGGSLAFNAIMLQPRRQFFERVFPRSIDFDQMVDVYYPRVRRIIGQKPIPKEILETEFYASTRANLEQAEKAGFDKGSLVEYAIDWDIVREELADPDKRAALDGQSWYGLNSGAKQSVDHNYLRLAERSGRTEVLPLHLVTDIGEDDGLYLVHARQIDTNGNTIRRKTFACKHLFLAAGSMGTSALLVRARAKRTLPKLILNPFVGRNWGSNGDFIVVRGGVGDFTPSQGGPCGHFVFEDLKNRFSPSAMVELVLPNNRVPFPAGFSLYVGLGLAPPVGFFTHSTRTDDVTLHWPASDPRLTNFLEGARSMVETLNAHNPGSFEAFRDPQLTAHPVGGAVFNRVCDTFGRVFGHPGLYIVDGACIPGGSVGGVNPAFTIAALAERSMERIINSDFERD